MNLHFKVHQRILRQVAFETHIMKSSVNIQELYTYEVKQSTYLGQDWIKTLEKSLSFPLF